MFVRLGWSSISQPQFFCVCFHVWEKEITRLAVTIVPLWPCLNHLSQVMRCVSVWHVIFRHRWEEWAGSLCYLQCHLIDLILVLLAFISLCVCVWSLSLPPLHSFPVPTATRGYWLHKSGACAVFVHVYVHVSVAAPGLGKSNTKHTAFRSYYPSGSCKCIIDSVNTDFTRGTCALNLHCCSLFNFH